MKQSLLKRACVPYFCPLLIAMRQKKAQPQQKETNEEAQLATSEKKPSP